MHALIFLREFGGRMHGLFDSFIMVWVMISVVAGTLDLVQTVAQC
ncbi:MAG: hypothetical protein ACJAR7_001160 [Polaromonas sp.]|jgi:hypothetical protein